MSEKNEENTNNEMTKKENFFKKLIKSIKDLDKYEDFALEKPAEGIKYIAKLVAVFCAIVGIVYTYNIITTTGRLYTGLKDKLPDFSYKEGVLTAGEEPTIIEDYADSIGSIIIDTNVDTEQASKNYQEQIAKYGSAVIATKENISIYNAQLNAPVTYRYSNLLANNSISEFTKQDVINQVDGLNKVSVSISLYLVFFVYLYVFYFASIMLDLLLLALLAYIVGRIVGIKLKSGPVFNIAAHAITLPVVLNLIYIIVNLLTGFNIKYFQIMYNAISYIYVVVAVLMIKTDFLNRQIELMKLAQEQMKIKEEMEKREAEKEQRKDENKKENDKEEGVGADDSKHPKKDKQKKEPKEPDEPLGDATIVPKGE